MEDPKGISDADLVASLYDIALDPERLDELVSSWTRRIEAQINHGPSPGLPFDGVGFLGEDKVLPHLSRVESILRAMMVSADAEASSIEDWVSTRNHAAVVFDRKSKVVAHNMAANRAFGLSPGADLSALGLEESDEKFLRQCVSGRMNSTQRERLLRMRQNDGGPPLVALVLDPLLTDSSYVGVITSAVTWPGNLTNVLEASFGLTAAECGVLKSLTLGKNVKEIAAETGRSEGTVRTHIHTLLSKTEARTQTELVRVALGLFDIASSFGITASETSNVQSLNNIYQAITLKDGRRLGYLDLCNKRGKPFLMLPGNISFTRLPAETEHRLAKLGFRMIVPIRAGYGYSSPIPPGRDAAETGVSDILELMDQLELGAVPILCMVSDLQIATPLASRAPKRVKAIVAASATLPLVEQEHFARLDKFTRFVMANGRRAPRTLGFIAMMFFIYAHRQGVRKFLELVLDGSDVDRKLMANPQIMDALIRGSHAILRPNFKAHVAWSQEIISFTRDWREALLQCPAPITLMVGDQSPWVPIQTVREFAARSDNIEVIEFPDTGQLLAYQHPDALIEQLERHMES